MNFKHNGVKDPEGGFTFAEKVRSQHQDIPILLQSSNPEFAGKARESARRSCSRGPPVCCTSCAGFMLENFGFGDFVFRTPDGREVGRAHNLKALEEQLQHVPDESILFHAERNHFSNWLKARTEFWLAHRLRPRKVSEFSSQQSSGTS